MSNLSHPENTIYLHTLGPQTNFDCQIMLQLAVRNRDKVNEDTDPVEYAKFDSEIAELTEALQADKFYDC